MEDARTSTVPNEEKLSESKRRLDRLNRILRLSMAALPLGIGFLIIATARLSNVWEGAVAIGAIVFSLIVYFGWPNESEWIRKISDPNFPLSPIAIGRQILSITLGGKSATFESIIDINARLIEYLKQEQEQKQVRAKEESSEVRAVMAYLAKVRNETSPSDKPPSHDESRGFEPSIPSKPHIPFEILRSFDESRARLLRALDTLSGKSQFNLVIGLLLASAGLLVATQAVFRAPPTIEGVSLWHSFAVHTLPKMVLGLLLELTAAFFLRLYRQGLDDFKYYHNEITNLESQWLALNAAYGLSKPGMLDDSIIANVIQRLAATERNFVLQKGETTVTAERDRLGGVSEQQIFRSLEAALAALSAQRKP